MRWYSNCTQFVVCELTINDGCRAVICWREISAKAKSERIFTNGMQKTNTLSPIGASSTSTGNRNMDGWMIYNQWKGRNMKCRCGAKCKISWRKTETIFTETDYRLSYKYTRSTGSVRKVYFIGKFSLLTNFIAAGSYNHSALAALRWDQ